MKVVEVLGSDRSRLYRLRRQHPLSPTIIKLFRDEEERFDSVIGILRKAAERCGDGLVAVWLYGSVARGEDRADSDVDVAVVARPIAVSKVQAAMRQALDEAEAKLAFSASVVVVGTDDVLRLAAARDGWWLAVRDDATVIAGDAPEILLQRLRRRTGPPQRAA
jgi:predicted nucleotidyltransferase